MVFVVLHCKYCCTVQYESSFAIVSKSPVQRGILRYVLIFWLQQYSTVPPQASSRLSLFFNSRQHRLNILTVFSGMKMRRSLKLDESDALGVYWRDVNIEINVS